MILQEEREGGGRRPRGGTPTVEHGAYAGRGSPRQLSIPGWVLNRHGLQEWEVPQGSENAGLRDQDQLQRGSSDDKLQGDVQEVARLVPVQRNSQHFLYAQIGEDLLYHLQ